MLQSAEKFLRDVAPADLQGCGCYVIDWREIAEQFPELRRDGVLAYTSPHLPSALQPWLEAAGRWIGDGFAAIVMRELIGTWHEVLGIATHELAHWLTGEPCSGKEQAESLAIVSEYASSDNSEPPSPPWLGHGPDFILAAAHLTHRAQKLVGSVGPHQVRFSRQYTGIPEPTWMAAIEKELTHSGPIRNLLTDTLPPPRFGELWYQVELGAAQ
jgi:hypothetical protein